MGFFKKHFDPKIDQVPIRILEIFLQIRNLRKIWPYKHLKKHTLLKLEAVSDEPHLSSEINRLYVLKCKDVDLLPEDDRNIYTCSNNPRHLSKFLFDNGQYNFIDLK